VATPAASASLTSGAPLLQVQDLVVRFPGRRGTSVTVIDGVSFDLAPGETLSLVGESGSGKTTIGRAILGLGGSGPQVIEGFHGVPYDTMQDDPATATDEAHMFEPHYDRHVWLYRENPNGVFKPFNPAVSCAHHVMETASAAP